jgi:hypothetical protein
VAVEAGVQSYGMNPANCLWQQQDIIQIYAFYEGRLGFEQRGSKSFLISVFLDMNTTNLLDSNEDDVVYAG